MAVNKMATWTSGAASMMLLALVLLASVLSARRHHSAAREADGVTEKNKPDGPAWERRRNNWTKGTDLLDWSRDPRRVDPKVYNHPPARKCGGSSSHWIYSMTGQLEGQELAAGLVKGLQVEPKSKSQLFACEAAILLAIAYDSPTEVVKDYLAKNDLLLERDMPLRSCYWPEVCPKRGDNCTTYRLDDPLNAERINVAISGRDSGRVEGLLRDYGPMAVFLRYNFTLHKDGFWDLSYEPGGPVNTDWQRDNFLLVGYGRTDDGVGYFKFKASRGPDWGDGGYGYFKHTSHAEKWGHLWGLIDLWKIKPCRSGRSLHKKSRPSKTKRH